MDSIGEFNVRLLRNFNMRWENYVDISLGLTRNAREVSKDIIPRMSSQTSEMEISGSGCNLGRSSTATRSMELPSIMLGSQLIFKAPDYNPTTSRRVGEKHILAIKGVPSAEDKGEYWKANGTAEFCDTLARHLSPRIGATLEHRGPCMSSRELVEFIDDASSHAASMRWLWYW